MRPRPAARLLIVPGLHDSGPAHWLSTVVASDTDTWMRADDARLWAGRWGSHWINLGDAGHINSEAGFGPLPFARRWVLAVEQKLRREARPALASFQEWQFAT